jgi:type I restriction enzyme R subunit
MAPIGKPERTTQERVIVLFWDELGSRSLGACTDRPYNSGVEESLLTSFPGKRGYARAQITAPSTSFASRRTL